MRRTGLSVGEHAANAALEEIGGGGADGAHPAAGRRRILLILPAIAIAGVFAWAIARLAVRLDFGLLLTALRTTPASRVAAAAGATAVSYLALVGYDLSGLRYARARLPLPTVLLGSFCGFAIGNTIGFGAFSGGAVRYRLYAAAGLSPGQIAKVILFIAGGFGVGLATIAAIGLGFRAGEVGTLLGTAPEPLRWAAAAILLSASALLAFCAVRRTPLGRLRIEPPGPTLVLTQLLIAALDILAAATVLWLLLPTSDTSFFAFAAIYATALGLGVVSHLPGGFGVFEVAILYAIGGRTPLSTVAAALVAYRAIYFFLPLLLATVLLGAVELRRWLGPVSYSGIKAGCGKAAPAVLGATVFAVGATLTASGAMPALVERFQCVDIPVPLRVVGASHFLTSFVGLALLIAAGGLVRRRAGAWWLTLSISALGFPLSLIKGLGVFPPSILIGLLTGLLTTRRHFRQQLLPVRCAMAARLPATAAVVLAFVCISGFVWYDPSDLRASWWHFEFDAAVPVPLRVTLAAAVVALAFGLRQLVRPPPRRLAPPAAEDIAQARRIAEAQARPDALLALMGDKQLLFSQSGSAFLMFATHGRTWAALGDPVGPPAEWPELIWRFIALAERHGGRAAFYQVPAASLPIYLDAGLRVLKLGEEARVDLPAFTLDGGSRADLRYALRRGERDGLDVEMIPPERVPVMLGELARISEAWLEQQASGCEKRFSVAALHRGYVLAQTIALLRCDGEPVAFASIMTTGAKDAVTLGLMRHVPGRTPPCAMEYLLARTIGFYREAGYRSFSLGVVPLSGLRAGSPAPPWHRVGRIIRSLGGRFYNFQGLRTFKAKFHPEWEPRYLAARGALGPYLALLDIAALIGSRNCTRAKTRRTGAARRHGAIAAALAIAAVCLPWRASALDGGSLGEVRLTQPAGPARAFVVLFSDASGWNQAADRAAAALAKRGASVVGVDLPIYLKHLDAKTKDSCHQAFGAVDFLSRQLQRQQENAAYLTPIVAGIGEGGTLAAAMLAQAPANTLAGAVAYEATPSLRTNIALCGSAMRDPAGGFSYGPWKELPGFLVGVFAGDGNRAGRQRFSALKQAGTPLEIENLPANTDPGAALAAVVDRRLALAAAEAEKRVVAALPLTELPSRTPSGVMAVILSGDGGWRDIDQRIAEKLRSAGVSVVGWDSLRYFWNRKSPGQTGRDLAAVIDAYARRWEAAKVVLVGYSFGADVLPFAYNQLPSEAKARVSQLSLLGISKKAVFQFSIAGWLGSEPDEGALATGPVLGRIAPDIIQCFYGAEDEADSACPALARGGAVTVIRTPGGHHFDHDYDAITLRILDGLRRHTG